MFRLVVFHANVQENIVTQIYQDRDRSLMFIFFVYILFFSHFICDILSRFRDSLIIQKSNTQIHTYMLFVCMDDYRMKRSSYKNAFIFFDCVRIMDAHEHCEIDKFD